MLSTRLVKLIENNWEEIATRMIRAIHHDPDLSHLGAKSDSDLREWCRDILKNLGYLLGAKNDAEIRRRFHVLGRIRFEENIPLHEAVRRFHLLKDKIVSFVHEQGFPMTTVQIYAEEELEELLSHFVDACVYQVVRGYEDAMQLAKRVAS